MLAAFLQSGIGEKDLKIIVLQCSFTLDPMLTRTQDVILQVLVPLCWGGIQGEALPWLQPST